ncbi:hypothetical protein [Anaerocolumna aminovalerica]|uniref:hypothetical protein n=1 Tax=Anaerocolumna aminovalerica TaxID=1527 RepID=UPI001C0F29C1|nr:hypothetical protein [Anaerocolumna aminovalerica]MBU5333900.1 hypothetical protein [Anaerocolumna aminovalerica]
MKHILLQWTYYADIISVPDKIADNLVYYQMEFDKWISNKNNNHNYWLISYPNEGEVIEGLCFDSNAFINWLNEFVIKNNNQKATFVVKEIQQIQPTNDQKKLPTIYF